MNDEAAQAETQPPASSTIDWDGVIVTLPASMEDVDPDFFEAMEHNRSVSALRALLTSDEYDRVRAAFKQKHGRRPSMKDINPLGTLALAHFGFEPGESAASSD